MKAIDPEQQMPQQHTSAKKPGVWNLVGCKCPRCRIGNMFQNRNPYALKETMKMHNTCPVCGQAFNIEVGFYYGSSYVSYALGIALSVASFIAWWLIIGLSINDNRIFGWIIFNAVFLVALQPWLMRVARTLWLAFFVKYDPDWKIHPAQIPERMNGTQENNW